jgi:5-deoxy-glucuronate isomerase
MSDFKATVSDGRGYNEVRLHPEHRFIQQFGILNLDKNDEYTLETGANEFGLLVLEGRCHVDVEGRNGFEVKSRANVFAGLPTGVYVPADSRFSVTGGKAKVAVCGGKCGQKTEPAVITPEQIKVMRVGKDNWSREVRVIIGPGNPSVNMILGETINPPGNWSGTPPHKHEVDDLPQQSLHEELYYFQFDKLQGWGIERFYSQERQINDLIYLENNTVTFMPWGYHQIVASPGYTLHYLFFLAGKGSQLIGFEDPEHNWIKKELTK